VNPQKIIIPAFLVGALGAKLITSEIKVEAAFFDPPHLHAEIKTPEQTIDVSSIGASGNAHLHLTARDDFSFSEFPSTQI
jgi:hypothetical protein